MSDIEVALPSGGKAWIVGARSHGQATVLRRHHLKINRFLGPAKDEDGNRTQDWKPDLTSEQLDEKDDLTLETDPLYVRTLTKRWQDVNDADGNALSFPDDIERMRDDDMEALAAAAKSGRPAPKAASGTSGPSSAPAASPPTPTSAKT